MPDKRLLGLAGAIFALLFAAVLSAPYRSIQGPQIEAHQRPEQADNSKGGGDQVQSGGLATPTGSPSVHATPADREGKAEIERGRQPSAEGEAGFLGTPLNAEAVIALFTILLFAATFALYLATRDLVKGADRNAERQLRPYVVLKPFIAKPELNAIDGRVVGWTFRCVWHNVGNTPTKHMVTKIGLRMNAASEPPDFGSNGSGPLGQAGRLFLGPGSEAASEKFAVSVDDMLVAATGQWQIYLWGSADYNDTFDKTPRHRTEFAVRIVIVGDPQSTDCGIGYLLYGPFNGIDDECRCKPEAYDPKLLS